MPQRLLSSCPIMWIKTHGNCLFTPRLSNTSHALAQKTRIHTRDDQSPLLHFVLGPRGPPWWEVAESDLPVRGRPTLKDAGRATRQCPEDGHPLPWSCRCCRNPNPGRPRSWREKSGKIATGMTSEEGEKNMGGGSVHHKAFGKFRKTRDAATSELLRRLERADANGAVRLGLCGEATTCWLPR